jgi:DNA-binding beta-propeller fold protein YncE/peroxiredoxin
MKISKKDLSFILLVTATLIVIWTLYSLFSSFFTHIAIKSSDLVPLTQKNNEEKWLNSARQIKISDLKNRILLVNFWDYNCINCIQVIAKTKELEREFAGKLTVIGVHCASFDNQDLKSVKKAVIKYNIDYPVFNDDDFTICNNFSANQLPKIAIINPRGKVIKTYQGQDDIEANLKSGIKKIINKYGYQINREALPILLEKNKITGHVLSFPTKLEYANDFEYHGLKTPVLFIANSGNNNIIVSSLSGDIIAKIGSGNEGFEDGDFENARFNFPHGLLYKNHKLYVADTSNNAIRVVDFKENKVTTLLGFEKSAVNNDSKQNGGKEYEEIENSVQLAAPFDLEFYPDSENIIIANSATNQILGYNLKTQALKILAGSGKKEMEDGKYPQNSLAQIADMEAHGNKIYFLDPASSALRVITKDGEVTTLIGQGLFKFGNQNGDKSTALMKHPLSLSTDDTGVYITDSYNNLIKKYDFATHKITNLVGSGQKGSKLGNKNTTEFDEPEGIIAVLDKFYIADSNNDRIIVVNRFNWEVTILNVMPQLKLPKEGLLEYLPNLQMLKNIQVSSEQPVTLKINLEDNYKINESAPSFINLLELTNKNQANLIANFDWNIIKNKEIKLPKLDAKKDYIIQGTIYYCLNQPNALCYISSQEQKIKALKREKKKIIEIKLREKL